MTDVPLYDMGPTARLMLMGLVVAIGPLAWVWLRNKNAPVTRRLQALTLLTLFLTFDLVLFGAFTRLTDSGLGCPDWPGCYGNASPVGAVHEIAMAQAALPSGPVTFKKAWIEMIHRYLATGVGVLILTLAISSWMERRRLPFSPWLPTLTLVWVCLQGAFGALTVTMKLFPAIVTLHLLGGVVLLALLRYQSLQYQSPDQRHLPTPLPTPANFQNRSLPGQRFRWLTLAAFALLWLQIALGGWVSTNYAVLACTDFPACQGTFWPPMDFQQGFTFWRELGKVGGAEDAHISFEALTAIHYVHRLMAYLLVPVLLVLSLRLLWANKKVQATDSFLRNHAFWLAGLTVLQVVTGVSNVVLGWPLLAAVLHTGGAAALVVVLTGLVFNPTRQSAPASQRLPHPASAPINRGVDAGQSLA